VRFKVDAAARGFEAVSVVNPAWLVADAMRVPAGEADATFFYQFRPTVSTGGQRVWLWNVTAHMHEFATRQRVMIVHADGRRECVGNRVRLGIAQQVGMRHGERVGHGADERLLEVLLPSSIGAVANVQHDNLARVLKLPRAHH
jgi:hypothetical protein